MVPWQFTDRPRSSSSPTVIVFKILSEQHCVIMSVCLQMLTFICTLSLEKVNNAWVSSLTTLTLPPHPFLATPPKQDSKRADTYCLEDHFHNLSFPLHSPWQGSLFIDTMSAQGQEMVWLTHRSLQFIRSQNNRQESRSDITGKGKICCAKWTNYS